MFSIGKFERNFKEVEDFQPKSKLANCALAQQANEKDEVKGDTVEDRKKFIDNLSS